MKEEGRQDAVLEALAERGLGALIVTDLANVRYLTGYVGSNGVAVLGPRGRSLLTDSRYAVAARAAARGVDVVIGRRDLLGDAAALVPSVAGEGAVGVEAESLTVARYRRLEAMLDAPPEPTTGIVESLREVKDADEIAAMREAAAVADRALAAVLGRGIVGRTERDVALAIYGALLDEGAERPSFETIVAAGPNGARPHAVPGPEPIPPNTLVTIDLGAVVDGYCSDMTRTVATGPLPPRLAEIYAVCLRAQQAALDAARAGMGAAELDAVARAVIGDAGYADAFGHGLGHGVGLAIHEAPGVRPEGTATLRAGMAVTIEPGIYLEGEGGVRIEDLVILGDEGCDILSHAPKELTIVD